MTIMVVTFIFERVFSLRKAQGRGSLAVFLKNVTQEINKGNIEGGIAACDKQRGSCANIIRTGLDKYKQLVHEGDVKGQKEMMSEVVHSSHNQRSTYETGCLYHDRSCSRGHRFVFHL
jgi:biopolymer transport protein ExbB